MANGEHSVHRSTLYPALIGAVAVVGATYLGVTARSGGGGSVQGDAAHFATAPAKASVHKASKTIDVAENATALPPHWIDAKGRYYEIKQSGDRLGIIAYKGGEAAMANDKTRLAGEGTLDGGSIRWSWQGAHGDKIEECAGTASASAIAVDCARDGRGAYPLRLVIR